MACTGHFTGLPLLLQAAVNLFFAGLVDFLVSLNLTVAIPVVVVIGLALAFLFGTTVLPTLQCFRASFSWRSQVFDMAQCPYKSPQAWAFRNLIIIILHISTQLLMILKKVGSSDIIIRGLQALQRLIRTMPFNHFMQPFSKLVWFSQRCSSRFKTIFSLKLCLSPNHHNWIDFDIFWLAIRDRHFQLSRGKPMPADEALDHTSICPPYVMT